METEEDSKKQWKRTIRIHFDEADPAGLLFFGSYFIIAHRFMEECLSSLFSWKEWYNNPHWGAPIRHAEAEYFSPLYAGDLCELTLSLKKIGLSSLSFELCFYKEEGLSAKLKITLVFMSRGEEKKERFQTRSKKN